MSADWAARADRLSARAIAAGEPTAWFDELYAAGAEGEISLPWERDEPHALLRQWTQRRGLRGEGRRAVVVGCGLGADAEYVASLGFATTAFDLSPTAVRLARERHPGTRVDYREADLRQLPSEWVGAFDLVVEIFTIQAVPDPPRAALVAGVRSLVAPGGTLLAIQFRYDGSAPADVGPPFPQTRETMESLAGDDLSPVSLEQLDGPLWRAEYVAEG